MITRNAVERRTEKPCFCNYLPRLGGGRIYRSPFAILKEVLCYAPLRCRDGRLFCLNGSAPYELRNHHDLFAHILKYADYHWTSGELLNPNGRGVLTPISEEILFAYAKQNVPKLNSRAVVPSAADEAIGEALAND
jgi:hypothetical protein